MIPHNKPIQNSQLNCAHSAFRYLAHDNPKAIFAFGAVARGEVPKEPKCVVPESSNRLLDCLAVYWADAFGFAESPSRAPQV